MRLAIPLMSKQAAGFHPVSYAVWYEFISGANSGLKAAIDEIISNGHVLDDATTAALFRKHIADIDEKTAQRISSGFQQVLANVSQSTSEAWDQTSRYSNSLVRWSEDVRESGIGSVLSAGITQLLGDTRDMHKAVIVLQDRLAESHQEIEELRQEVNRAREDALSDSLTGLVNRRGFDQALAECLAEADQEGKLPSILIADIDHIKIVNETYGHLFGDKVICAFAQILKQNIKGKDMGARYGGEEFVILLPDTPLHGALALAESIRATIEGIRIKRVQDNAVATTITVSLGVASYRKNESVSDFVGRADQALYESKRQGRNRVTSESFMAA
jgi:diguanylate cyclase